MPQKFEHAIRFVGGASFVQWATFHYFEDGKLRFYEGAMIVSVGNHVAGESVITTEGAHGLNAGAIVRLVDVANSVPDVNKEYPVIAVLSPTQFVIAETVTNPGFGGRCGVLMRTITEDAVVSSVSVGRFEDQRPRDDDSY